VSENDDDDEECGLMNVPTEERLQETKQVKYYKAPSILLRLTTHAKKAGTQKILINKDLIFVVDITDVIKLHN